ncbi:hypothetical protein [Rhizobium leguminosarum]|nr:hypothetical protein [Rhizobium leguminosarum]
MGARSLEPLAREVDELVQTIASGRSNLEVMDQYDVNMKLNETIF